MSSGVKVKTCLCINLSLSNTGGTRVTVAGAYSSCHWARGRVHGAEADLSSSLRVFLML